MVLTIITKTGDIITYKNPQRVTITSENVKLFSQHGLPRTFVLNQVAVLDFAGRKPRKKKEQV